MQEFLDPQFEDSWRFIGQYLTLAMRLVTQRDLKAHACFCLAYYDTTWVVV